MTDKIIVLTTCGTAEDAERLARLLVEKRLAACVSVLGKVQSVYRWQGALENSPEWLLVIKSRRDLFPRLREQLAAAHSYEVPEILALPVIEGLESYLEWMDRELCNLPPE